MKPEFEQTIKENTGVLHKLCRVYTYNADEYEELFQEMLVQIWSSMKNFRAEAAISTWIYQIQSITAAMTLVPVFFYPRMIFASAMLVVLGIWYVRELRRLYQPGEPGADLVAVKDSLNAKILTMKNYFRRTRFVLYVLCPAILPAAFYGFGLFDKPSLTLVAWAIWFSKYLVIYEIGMIIATEIYFKITYAPALNELKTLLRQLDSETQHE